VSGRAHSPRNAALGEHTETSTSTFFRASAPPSTQAYTASRPALVGHARLFDVRIVSARPLFLQSDMCVRDASAFDARRGDSLSVRDAGMGSLSRRSLAGVTSSLIDYPDPGRHSDFRQRTRPRCIDSPAADRAVDPLGEFP